jgi:hypothetical protein
VVLDVPRPRPAAAKPSYGMRAAEHFAIARLWGCPGPVDRLIRPLAFPLADAGARSRPG